mmetsp:Transcript_105525/g.268095  ORF Transcript_105525/g.268095 Transcript_105525/m.268095 type:complete len:282 (-) Transcript_105525:216-1061(-)
MVVPNLSMPSNMYVLAVVLSFFIGVSLGLLGGGGSILTVPTLVYVLGVDPKKAIAMSLVVVGITSLAALVAHARAGNVAWRMGVIFGLSGMAGSFLGGICAFFLSGRVLLILFALMAIGTSFAMLCGSQKPAAADAEEFSSANGRLVVSEASLVDAEQHEHPLWRIILDGLIVGVVTGLVGAGGGFLVVPALVLLAGLDIRVALGTSLLVISMKSFAGYLGHALHEKIDFQLTAVVSLSAVLGSFLGGYFTLLVPQQVLRKGFAALVLVVGVLQLVTELMA